MNCPNPLCKEGMVRFPFPLIARDRRGRPIFTDRLPCAECIGSVASCCDGAIGRAAEVTNESR